MAGLPLAVGAVIALPIGALPAHATTITSPTYVRTIGGPNGEALTYPSGLAVDAAGNVYVADTGNYLVEKWAAGTGTPTAPVWTVGVRGAPIGGGSDSFQAPRDVAVEPTATGGHQYVYVADTDDAIVQVLNASNGSYVTTIGPTFGSSRFSDPIGITVGSDGSGNERILVSDGVSGNVFIFDSSFNLVRTIAPTAKNEGTRDASTDSAGNVYTADYRGNTVDEYAPGNNGPTPTIEWGNSSNTNCQDVAKPYGVQVDTADTPNRIYVASSNLEQVKVFDPSGNCLNVGTTGFNAIGTPGTGTGQLFQLRRVAVGQGSNPLIYAADLWGLKILTYNSTDGSLASSAQPEIGNGVYPAAGNLNEPHDIAIANNSTPPYIFTTDTVNQRVERFNLDGSNPIAWGTKGVAESTASFNWAQGVGYDAANGNVWVANTRNNRIDEFSKAGAKLSSFPAAGRLNSIFDWPMAVAFDPAGNMYVADTYHNQVMAFSVSGNTVNTTPLWTSPKGLMIKPWSLVYDGAHSPARLLVTDTYNNRVLSLNPTTGASNGVVTGTRGTAPGAMVKPEGIAVDASDNIWVADTSNNRVEEFTPNGAFADQMIGTYGSGYNAPNNEFNAPQGLAFDSTGLLYVADPNNNRIQVYQPAAAGAGPPTYFSQLSNPAGVAPLYPAGGETDGSGNMFVADSGRSEVDEIASGGAISHITPDTGTPLSNPRNLSIDVTSPNDLWVSDTGNNAVIEMSTAGHVLERFNSTTVSGLTMKEPFGLANDSSAVYVADTYDNRVIALSKTDGHIIWAESTCTSPLSRPRDLTVGSDGNVYAVDTDHARVVEFSTAGACLASWHGTTRTLKVPRAISSDGNGGLWIVEAGNNPDLVHMSDDGSTFYGASTNAGNFVEPEGVFTNGGNVEVADPFAFQLDTFSVSGGGAPSATATNVVGGVGPAVGGFNNPFGVAYAPNGDCFVSDMFNQRIEKFPGCNENDPTASGLFGGGVGHMQNPRGISVSPDGSTVILTNSEDNRIDLFNTSDLSFIKSIAPPTNGACGNMFWPDQSAYDATDNTYWVADTNNNRVLELDSNGNCLENWKASGTGFTLSAPRGIAWDGTNVWVSNTQRGQILKCSVTGTCTIAISRPATTNPWNLTLANGNLYVADEGAARIEVFGLDGTLQYTFGSPGSDTSAGQFESPRSVSVDTANGQVAVADFDANVISLWH